MTKAVIAVGPAAGPEVMFFVNLAAAENTIQIGGAEAAARERARLAVKQCVLDASGLADGVFSPVEAHELRQRCLALIDFVDAGRAPAEVSELLVSISKQAREWRGAGQKNRPTAAAS